MEKKQYIGLDGKPVKNPKYYCRSHQIYLDDNDIALKHCMYKASADMIETHACKWLCTIEQYENDVIRAKELRDEEAAKARMKKVISDVKSPNWTQRQSYKNLIRKKLEEQRNG